MAAKNEITPDLASYMFGSQKILSKIFFVQKTFLSEIIPHQMFKKFNQAVFQAILKKSLCDANKKFGQK